MKPAKYNIGDKVKTPHGNGRIVGRNPHRLDPESSPQIWMYGVESKEFCTPSNQLPFFEEELTPNNSSSATLLTSDDTKTYGN